MPDITEPSNAKRDQTAILNDVYYALKTLSHSRVPGQKQQELRDRGIWQLVNKEGIDAHELFKEAYKAVDGFIVREEWDINPTSLPVPERLSNFLGEYCQNRERDKAFEGALKSLVMGQYELSRDARHQGQEGQEAFLQDSQAQRQKSSYSSIAQVLDDKVSYIDGNGETVEATVADFMTALGCALKKHENNDACRAGVQKLCFNFAQLLSTATSMPDFKAQYGDGNHAHTSRITKKAVGFMRDALYSQSSGKEATLQMLYDVKAHIDSGDSERNARTSFGSMCKTMEEVYERFEKAANSVGILREETSRSLQR